MGTVQESLQGLSMYPIPSQTLTSIATQRGCNLEDVATSEVLASANYNLAKADVYRWLSVAPDISQGGQNYSFTDKQRQYFCNQAEALSAAFADADDSTTTSLYGYKGDTL